MHKDDSITHEHSLNSTISVSSGESVHEDGSEDGAVVYAQGVNADVVREHGLSSEEYRTIVKDLERAPNFTELGIYSALWSEHCSYKSSKHWLAELPSSGDHVIHGPGENAGVIDIGDGLAAVFKIESHNHPSYIVPFHGAATGVGGIMRDVFAMGARPIANLNALRFGSENHKKTKSLLEGVAAGIGFYGNCTGIPTIGGDTGFAADYNENILVNAMCIGIAPHERIFTSRASDPGSVVMYVGGRTGRDGVHGASMSSAGFDSEVEEDKRPSVQIGDPFLEKLLMEGCLELMESKAVLAVQDMGAAGLTSSGVEMAARGKCGIELDLDLIPCRESDLSAYEIMLSESQERMLIVLDPNHVDEAQRILKKWDLSAVAVGRICESPRLLVRHRNQVVIDLPIASFENNAPKYQREHVFRDLPKRIGSHSQLAGENNHDDSQCTTLNPEFKSESGAAVLGQNLADISVETALITLMSSTSLCSRRWIWQQYDHLVGGNSLLEPGSGASAIRIPEHKEAALAACVDAAPRYCQADPHRGAVITVAEARRNLIAVGAKPLAITNNLNFGSPENPEVMGDMISAIRGIAHACREFNLPVVSGNVSLYNETDGRAISPTPVIGAVGIIPHWNRVMGPSLKSVGDSIFMIGPSDWDLGQSLFARQILEITEGAPPEINLETEIAVGNFISNSIETSLVNAVQDISDGGLLVALAEMALSGDLGVEITIAREKIQFKHSVLFSESQSRYVVTAGPGKSSELIRQAQKSGIAIEHLGIVTGHRIVLPDGEFVSLDKLRKAHESTLPDLMQN